MSDVEERLARLEAQVRELEDHRAVLRLVASYGPSVDRGDAEAVAALWVEDGVYDVDTGRYEGREGIAGMVRSDLHQGLLQRGCAHLLTPPDVHVDGDTAVAVGHSQLVVRSTRGYEVARATAHRWELRRGAAGWRVVRRTSRVLDGGAEARELLRLPGR